MDLLLYHNICFDSDFYLLYVVSNNFSQTIFIKKKKKKRTFTSETFHSMSFMSNRIN